MVSAKISLPLRWARFEPPWTSNVDFIIALSPFVNSILKERDFLPEVVKSTEIG